MPSERFYLPLDFSLGSQCTLDGIEFHHLVHVMRAKSGDTVELVNGAGCLALAKIDSIDKKKASLSVIDVFYNKKQAFDIILAQAIPRINRLDFILEKGTELGMTKLWLFPGALSERKDVTEHQLDRMQGVAISAMKQCGRLWLPKIEVKPKLTAWNSLPCKAYYGDVTPEAPLFSQELKGLSDLIFFVGPESGFSPSEETILKKLGAKGVKLHANILRTDTASLAALTIITHHMLSDSSKRQWEQ